MTTLAVKNIVPHIQLDRKVALSPPTQLKLQFWGTRGSIPVSGANYVQYGGNTSCVTLTSDSGHLFIFDCGSGARELGNNLLSSHSLADPIEGYVLFSHTHWDHIQGFPFFTPLFRPTSRFNLVGWSDNSENLIKILAGQMQENYFPVSLEAIPAHLGFYAISNEYSQYNLDGAILTTQILKHTMPSVAYKLELANKTIVYATDHEPHCVTELAQAQMFDEAVIDPKLVAFAHQADVLIHDAQYTHSELACKVGWGHSSIEVAVDTAIKAQVKQLVLYHHDPAHDDATINAMLETARARAAQFRGAQHLEIVSASDGLCLEMGVRG